MPLKDRRSEYSWPPTVIDGVSITTDKRSYGENETIKVNLGFRIVGGLREAFHPDIWTVAWEDFDKVLRLTMKLTLNKQRGVGARKLVEMKKEVRKASFYWSRDPDLPYRIWVMVMPEDGGPPQIPKNVEDAKSKMLDGEKEFQIRASDLGPGSHRIFASMAGRWGRRSFIEKGEVAGKSKPMVVRVE